MKIAVLGGGNGSFAAASDFALQGHDVRLWRRDLAQVAAHRAAGSRIVLKDVHGRHDVPLTLVTFTLEEADGGTRVTVTETGFGELFEHRRQRALQDNTGGWKIQMAALERHFNEA